jgi:hypothetical protein
MRPSGHRRDDSWTSFGQRRGISDTARFGLNLTQTRAGSGGAAGRGSYPSPPMSGSPPLPLKTSPEVPERSQGTYQATTQQDVYSSIPTTQNEERTQTGAASGQRAFYSDASERASYTFPRLDAPGTRPPPPYPQPLSQGAAQPSPYLPGPGTGATANHPGSLPPPQVYPPGAHHPTPDSLHDTPPKSQRKTKGHVASACVPCKKAHLRFVVPVLTPSWSPKRESADGWQMRRYVPGLVLRRY